jgi:hypothetical protein
MMQNSETMCLDVSISDSRRGPSRCETKQPRAFCDARERPRKGQ